jgi:predicted metal-dependent phosphoesterase TrpH
MTMPKLANPYAVPADARQREWLRGNLHTHSTRSDGSRHPQAVIDDYANRGYGFLMLSDHDTFAGPEHFAQWNSRGLALIPGNEVTRDGPHLLHVGATRKVEPSEDRQAVLDEIRATGGFAVVNHPNWFAEFDHCPHEKMRSWNGFLGVEIFNHVIGELEGSQYATDHWDRLLSKGRRVWGFANDDAHHAQHVGHGWNTVLADERTADAVVGAMSAGRFYASTGVTVERVESDGMRARIVAPDAERIVAITKNGMRLKVADGRELEVEVPADKTYVRFECYGRGERQAWSQPLFVEG